MVFDHPNFDQHERVIFVNEPEAKLRAIISIHSLALGSALGGCRMRQYESADAALSDALQLSRAMSYKNALGDRPFGGAKAVIVGDPQKDKTPELLLAFGAAIDKLRGDYITAEDAGISPPDIIEMSKTTPFIRNIAAERGGPAPYTAYGIYIAIKAALDEVLSKGIAGATVSVQGLGGVGMDLCNQLHKSGARLIVSDIDPERVACATAEFGALAVATNAAHRQQVDVFAPCAFGGVLDATSVPELQSPIVAGAANNQLANAEDGQNLAMRNIVYCPDYVINAGGIRSTEVNGVLFDHEKALRRVEGIETVLRSIIAESRLTGISTATIADKIANERIRRAARPI